MGLFFLRMETDIAIIGGGPAGYVAAIRASQLGAKVILVEKGEIGGTCLNRGCIPTKSLLESAKRYNMLSDAGKFGLNVENFSFDYIKIQKRKNQIVTRLVKGIEFLLKNNSVQIVRGTGSFIDSHTISVKTQDETYTIITKKTIIATGSKSSSVPIPGIQGVKVLNSNELLMLDRIPDSILIIGGGIIGDEFASIFNSFGCKVTIVEMLSHLIPMEDREISIELEAAFKRMGIKVYTNSKVTGISDAENGEKVVKFLDHEGVEQIIRSEYVLVSVGRTSVIEDLNLDVLESLDYGRGITVNYKMETTIPDIYAIGDVIQGVPSPMLAYTASQEGEIAVENALGNNMEMKYHGIPSAIFTFPEVASAGLTEDKAKETHEVLVGKFPFQGNGRAIIAGENRGFVKVILDKKTTEILGVHIIGPHATELIAEASLAVTNRLHAKSIIKTAHGHPVLYESIKEAVLDALGRAIHK
ncbi:MAG: dihydrolipoyl dehydrogenase [Candidatus Heimdallarchaeota archaeon]|nr:dihydrolipoyl dehydrogenase [Candidatus Heimdallarchaeota archaeon]